MQLRLRNFALAGLLTLLVSLAACSTVKTGYNNAQDLSYWWLNRYVQFNASQKPLIKAELAQLHDWHRLNEIPTYIKILESLEQQASQDITSKQACMAMESIRERHRVLHMQLEPIIEKIAPTLSADQLAHVQRHFDKNNKKWRKEWLMEDYAEQNKYRLKRAIKRAEMFYGDLEKNQVEILKESIRLSRFDPHYSYEERLRRQADAIVTLRKIIDQKLTEPDIKLEIAAYFDRYLNGDMAYQDYIDRIKADACEDFAKLHNSTTAEQRQHAVKKLAGYAKDLKALKSSMQLDH